MARDNSLSIRRTIRRQSAIPAKLVPTTAPMSRPQAGTIHPLQNTWLNRDHVVFNKAYGSLDEYSGYFAQET
jgi:hypothetical protein